MKKKFVTCELLFLFLVLTSSLLEKQTFGPVYRPDGQTAIQDVLINVSPPGPRVKSWTERLSLSDDSHDQVDLLIERPYWEFQLVQTAYVPFDTSAPKASVTLKEQFQSSPLVREQDNALLAQILRVITTISGTDSHNTQNLPLNPLENVVATMFRNGSVTPPSRRRRLLADEPSPCENQVTLECILMVCGNGLTSNFSRELFDICTTDVPQSLFTQEEIAQNQMECVVAGACRAHTQCSPGGQVRPEQECQENILSEVRASMTVQLQSQQSQQLTFWQSFFTASSNNLAGYLNLTSILVNATQAEVDMSNATLAIIQDKQNLLANISNVLLQLGDQQQLVADSVLSYTQRASTIFDTHAPLVLETVNAVDQLVTLNANLRLSLRSALNVLEEQNSLARLHLTSAIETAAQTYSIWQGITRAVLQLVNRPQIYSELARSAQALLNDQQVKSGMTFFGRDRGVAPSELPDEVRYVTLGNSYWAWVDFDTNTSVRTQTQFICDLQQFVLDDLPRNTITSIPTGWIRNCWSPLGELVSEMSLDPVGNATQLTGCRCWLRVQRDEAEDAVNESRLFNRTDYVTQSVDAIMNGTRFLSLLRDQLCLDAQPSLWLQTDGLGTTHFPLDVDPADRTYCESDPSRAELWVQPAQLDAFNTAPPALTYYQQLLVLMQTLEPRILKGSALNLGRLPVPSIIERSPYQLAPQLNLTDADEIRIDIGAPIPESSSDAIAVLTETVQMVTTSINSHPVWKFFGKQTVVEGQVESSDPGMFQIVQTSWPTSEEGSVLPGQFYMAGYPGCWKVPCPIRPTFLGPDGIIMGFQTKLDTSNDVVGVFPSPSLSAYASDSVDGWQMHLFDVPQDLFSFAKSESSRRDTVSYLMRPSSESYSDFLKGHIETMLGPVYQKPGITYEEWKNVTAGELQPKKARVSLKLFRMPFVHGLPDLSFAAAPDLVVNEFFSNWTDNQCVGPRYASSGITPCGMMDRNFFDFNATRGTLRLYPRDFELQVTARVRVSNDTKIQVRPAASDLAGRALSHCPDLVTVEPRQGDFTHVNVMYRLLPLVNVTVVMDASACVSSVNPTPHGGGQVRIDTGALRAFATQTLSVPGCETQVVQVWVEHTSLSTNTCLVWHSDPVQIGIQVVRDIANEANSVQTDSLGVLLQDLGFLASLIQNSTLDLAQRAMQDLFSAQFNQTVNAIDAELAGFQARLDATRADVQTAAAQVHSDADAMVTAVQLLETTLNESRIRPEDILAAFNQTDELMRLLNEINQILPSLELAINQTRELARNLSGVNFIFDHAPTNFSWSDLALFLRALKGISCPATWDATLEKEAAAAAKAYECSLDMLSLACISGNLIPFRFLIYCVAWTPPVVGVWLLLSYTEYFGKGLPKEARKGYNKVLNSSNTKAAPHAARYVRPVVVVAALQGVAIGLTVPFLN